MADVSVEFGAVDVGLQKTLKTIQDELTGLRSKVNSGELSIEELGQTMRRVGQVESMEKRIKAMGDNSAESASQVNRLESELRQLDRANDSVNGGGISFGKLTAAISGAYAAIMGFQEAFMFIGDSIKKSSDLAETMNKVNVVFGTAAGAVSAFADTAVQELGMTRQQALDAASTFAVFGKSAGLAGGELVGFSRNLVQLATDFASFYNTSPEEAIQAIGAALRGESEPIRKYGILLDDATLKAEAMKLGLYDGKGAIDSQAKALAAYNAILGQSGIAQGDFSETSGSLSNQLKITTASFAELKTEIGNELQPAAQSFVEFLNQSMIPTLRDVVKEYKEYSDSVHDAAMGNLETNEAAGKATGGLDLLREMAVSIVGPIGDLISGTSNYRDAANAAAEAAKKGAGEIKKVGDAAATAAPQMDQAAANSENAEKNLGNLGDSAQDASGKLTKASLEAAAASGEFSGLASKAEDTGNSIASAFTLNSDFKPTVDGISSGWSDLNSEIAGTKPQLESNFSLADSIAGKVEEQVQSIGEQNDELETTAQLNKLIDYTTGEHAKKVAEIAAKQAERQAGLRENLELDLAILKAQISGNEEEFKALNYKKDYNAALKQAIDAGMGKSEAEAFADQIARARQEQAGINKELSATQKRLKDINDAQAKNRRDRGGRLEKQVKDRTEAGDFAGARRASAQLARKEDYFDRDASVRGEGPGRDRRSLSDIGADYNLKRQLGETDKSFQDRIKDARAGNSYGDRFGRSQPFDGPKNDPLKPQTPGLDSMKDKGSLKDDPRFAKKSPQIDKPGQDGKTGPDKSPGGKRTLDTLVDEILKLVQKIEPRLPVAALTA